MTSPADATNADRAAQLFEAALLNLGLPINGDVEPQNMPEARRNLLSATTHAPSLADGWLCRYALGEQSTEVLSQLWTHRDNLGKALAWFGLRPSTIGAKFNTSLYVTDAVIQSPDEVTAAYANALIGERRYAEADKVIGTPTISAPLTCYTALVLNSRTERWDDVIRVAELLNEYQQRAIAAPARAICVVAQARLGLYSAALSLAQSPLLDVDGMGNTVSKGLLDLVPGARAELYYIVGMCLRQQGDHGGSDMEAFRHALTADPNHAGAMAALNDVALRLVTTTAAVINSRTDPWDPATAIDPDELNKEELEAARRDALSDAEAKLETLIGQREVKGQVLRLKSSMRINIERVEAGLAPTTKTHHLVFGGPPGTGKTTIARIVAKIYFALGICKTPNVREVSRADFLAEHLGGTEAKTNLVIDSALDGVLFIDEAYSIIQKGLSGGDAFGKIVVDTLLARMENDRDRLVVAIAGYNNELDRFLDSNEGLASRFTKRILFPSYTSAELVEIAEHMAFNGTMPDAAAPEMVIEQAAQLVLARACDHLAARYYPPLPVELVNEGVLEPVDGQRPMIDIAGNGRFIRNVIENAVEEQQFRLDTNPGPRGPSELSTLLTSDMEGAVRYTLMMQNKPEFLAAVG